MGLRAGSCRRWGHGDEGCRQADGSSWRAAVGGSSERRSAASGRACWQCGCGCRLVYLAETDCWVAATGIKTRAPQSSSSSRARQRVRDVFKATIGPCRHQALTLGRARWTRAPHYHPDGPGSVHSNVKFPAGRVSAVCKGDPLLDGALGTARASRPSLFSRAAINYRPCPCLLQQRRTNRGPVLVAVWRRQTSFHTSWPVTFKVPTHRIADLRPCMCPLSTQSP